MIDAILRNLEARTGKGVDDWAAILRKSGPHGRRERVDWLMKEQGLGRVASTLIVQQAEGARQDYSDHEKLVDGIFSGPKAALRPLYDKVAAAAQELGPDVKIEPRQSMITFTRHRQFAWAKASTSRRLDLGLALGAIKAGGRLLAVTGTNEKDRVRVRIALEDPKQVDAEVRNWLRRAYDLDRG